MVMVDKDLCVLHLSRRVSFFSNVCCCFGSVDGSCSLEGKREVGVGGVDIGMESWAGALLQGPYG